jgi:hypothetical protein
MADVILTCDSCGEETKVSQYIDPENAKCSACGELLDMPMAAASRPRGPQKKEEVAETSQAVSLLAGHGAAKSKKKRRRGDPVADDPAIVDRGATVRMRQKQRKKRMMIGDFIPSMKVILAIFVLLAGILTFLRFGGALSHSDKMMLSNAGMIGLAFGWICVVVSAFSDNMMFGLLSIMIPGYFIGYLYTKSDSLFLRFAMGVLIIPFGIDGFIKSFELFRTFIGWFGGNEFLGGGM